MATNEFEAAVQGWLEKAQAVVNRDSLAPTPEKLSLEYGRKYVRVVQESPGSRSAFCFIDITNGDVRMAASWKTPAKHPRGNIYGGAVGVTAYGAVYLR
jgi:hypothetical protein